MLQSCDHIAKQPRILTAFDSGLQASHRQLSFPSSKTTPLLLLDLRAASLLLSRVALFYSISLQWLNRSSRLPPEPARCENYSAQLDTRVTAGKMEDSMDIDIDLGDGIDYDQSADQGMVTVNLSSRAQLIPC